MQVVDYEKLCDAILRLDDKMRFVGVYLKSKYYKKMRENTTSYLSEEQTEESLKQALVRWNSRKKFSGEMGLPLYSVTRHLKVYLITMPFQDGVLGFSTEPDIDINRLVSIIFKIINS